MFRCRESMASALLGDEWPAAAGEGVSATPWHRCCAIHPHHALLTPAGHRKKEFAIFGHIHLKVYKNTGQMSFGKCQD